jgi:integrase
MHMAAKRDFTDRFLKAIKPAPAGKRVLHWDAQVPGFGVRVTDKAAPGSGSFVLMTRYPGSDNPTARFIGDYPAMSLSRAREIAREWRDDIRQGIDPKIRIERQRAAEAQERVQTFRAAFEAYADDHLRDLRSGAQVRSAVERLVYPKWGDRPLKEIRRLDVIDLIRDVKNKVGPIAGNRLLSFLKAFWAWALNQGKVDDSPVAAVKRMTKEKDRVRKRTLNDTELRMFWQACGELGVFGNAFKTMLLSGQRRTEVGAMRRSELDMRKKLWTIPQARTKGKREHEVPLSDAVVEIINTTPKLAGSAFVFSTGAHRTGDSTAIAPISGWGKAKEALDRIMALKAREIAAEIGGENAAEIAPWTLHDLRRSCATRLAELGVPRIVISAVLNHSDASVTGTYDHHPYSAEKRNALDRLATHLLGIVDGTADNVVQLAARA